MNTTDWRDQDVDDHVLGSGAVGSVPWLVDVVTEGHGKGFNYTLIMSNPDAGEGERPLTIYRLTRDAVREVAQQIADGQHEVAPDIRESIRNDDPDAGAVDAILQICAYGRIVYS